MSCTPRLWSRSVCVLKRIGCSFQSVVGFTPDWGVRTAPEGFVGLAFSSSRDLAFRLLVWLGVRSSAGGFSLLPGWELLPDGHPVPWPGS
jgi:hypothetical protein